MTSPFQSIKDMVQQGHISTPKPANDLQAQQSLDDMIAGMFARHSANHVAASIAQANQSTAMGRAPSTGTLPPVQRPPLQGGTYSENDAIILMNSHFMIGKSPQEVAVFRKNSDGSISFVPKDDFQLEVQNIFVKDGGKLVPVDKYWKQSPDRDLRNLIFEPGRTAKAHEYNLWRGFAIDARKGWQKQRRFLRHLLKIICRRNKQKFKYLMRLLAWFVQNPDKHAEVVLVLKSREQGTGKSTVGKVMLDIFGQHGFLVDDKERLLGRFNDWLDVACFVLAEEILFAGDLKADDKMKSMVTSDVLQVEGKYRSCRQVANHTKFIATTNHDHAVAAGSRERRKVVYDISNEHVGDRAWFDALYGDLANGGTGEFLWLLLNLKLGNWHPRMIIKTDETAEQQRMSGDSVSQWSLSCIDADEIVLPDGSRCYDLGTLISFPDLLSAYTGFCKKTGQRAVPPETFGSACTKMLGAKSRLSATPGSTKRPSAYHVPTGSNWQQVVNKRLGL